MPPHPAVLLVAPRGPSRRALAGVLRGRGWRVQTAADAFGATDAFVRSHADLVLLSLEGLGRRDLQFLRVVRRRAPDCPVLLLAPEGRRGLARLALGLGASLVLPEPAHAEELLAAIRILVPPRTPGPASPSSDARAAIRALGTEIDHALRNPLQALVGQVQLAQQAASWEDADNAYEAIQRVRDALDVLSRYTQIGPPTLAAQRPGPLMEQALARVVREKAVRLHGGPPAAGPLLLVDGLQIQGAVTDLLRFLSTRARRRPLTVRAGVHRTTRTWLRARGVRAAGLPDGPLVELTVQGRDLELDPRHLVRWENQVLGTTVRTRRPRPGLAVPSLVARLHGGALVLRPNRRGTVLGLVLPRP